MPHHSTRRVRIVRTSPLFAYTTRQGWTPTSPATGLERRRPRTDRDTHARARAIPAPGLLAFLDTEHPLREKTLWRLLYETAARAGEVLALNVADLDLRRRRTVVLGKGGRVELIGWETKTARLLPRHLRSRRNGPLFLTDIAPAPGRQPALTDPDTGRARLSYRRPAKRFNAASGGATLHQLRHSRLTHLAEAGVGLTMLIVASQLSWRVLTRPVVRVASSHPMWREPARFRRWTARPARGGMCACCPLRVAPPRIRHVT